MAFVEAIESQAHLVTDEQRKFIRAAVVALDAEENQILYCARLATQLTSICPCHASLVCVAAMDRNGFTIDVRDAWRLLCRYQLGEVDLRSVVEWLGSASGEPPDPWRYP